MWAITLPTVEMKRRKSGTYMMIVEFRRCLRIGRKRTLKMLTATYCFTEGKKMMNHRVTPEVVLVIVIKDIKRRKRDEMKSL